MRLNATTRRNWQARVLNVRAGRLSIPAVLAVALATLVGATVAPEARADIVTPRPSLSTAVFDWSSAVVNNPTYNGFSGVDQTTHAKRILRRVTGGTHPGYADEILMNGSNSVPVKRTKNSLWKKRMGAGTLPRLRTLGFITSAVFAADIGWKVGRVIDNKFLKLTPADYCSSIFSCIWEGDVRTEPARISPVVDDTWTWSFHTGASQGHPANTWSLLVGAGLTVGVCRSDAWVYDNGFWWQCLQNPSREAIVNPLQLGSGTNIGVVSLQGRTSCNQYSNPIASDGNPDDLPPGSAIAPYTCGTRYATEAQMENALRAQTFKEWEAADGNNVSTTGFALPAESAVDPGAPGDSDSSGDDQLDHWTHPDQDYPSPTPESNLNPEWTGTMPDCTGLTQAACEQELVDAGLGESPITTVELGLDSADLTLPAGGVVLTLPAPGQEWINGEEIELQLNPDPLPFELPAPQVNETAEQYRDRLVALGYVGTVVIDELLDDSPYINPAMGPSAVTRVTVTTTTDEITYAPQPWPAPFPRAWPDPTRTPTIRLTKNPASVPRAPTPGTGVPGLDFTPITGLPFGCKFPWGFITCYALGVTEWFDVELEAPGWTMAVAGVDEPYAADLSYFDDYMATWRALLSVVLWVGAVYLLAVRFLGFNAGGDPGGAIDDVL